MNRFQFKEKRFNSFSQYMKDSFGHKVIKLTLDGNFTCPNRDATLDTRGCIFCSAKGSGDFTFSSLPIKEQIDSQVELLSKKWAANPNDISYIAYFQNFSNTYKKTPKELEDLYQEALSQKDVVGLAIATRPDCLDEGILDLLERLNEKTFLFVELGLQTIHKKTSKYLRLCYDVDDFDKAVIALTKRSIKTVAHTIVSLPNEDEAMMKQTYLHLNTLPIWGIKIQMLNVLKGTDLEKEYQKHRFYLLNLNQYVRLVCDVIENLRQNIVIHRLTGDGPRDLLLEPRWVLNKRAVLNSIDRELKARDTFQGKNLS